MSSAVRVVRRGVRAAVACGVLVGSMGLPVAQASSGGVWWVAATGTAGAGTSCSAPDYVGATHASIQSAIDAAASGDEVRICSGTYAIGTTLTIGKNLTIVGQSYPLPILDGGEAARIMHVNVGGVEVSISGVHVRDGYTDTGEGGAGVLAHRNATLIVSDSYFDNNRAPSGSGGAISLSGDVGDYGSLEISTSAFRDNHAYDGGAISYTGVRGATPEATSLVTDSTFITNTAERNGGALNGPFTYLTATNSTFLDNVAINEYSSGHTSWSTTVRSSLIVHTTAVPDGSVACQIGDGEPRDGNVSTDASCLADGVAPVSVASLELGDFAPWGGSTPSLSIGATSSARNAVALASCTSSDQRGYTRSGTTCDAGAFEFQADAPSVSSSSSISLIAGRAIDSMPIFSTSGLTAPITYRFPTEVEDTVPTGVTMSSAGRVSGTPATSSIEEYHLVTATDAGGVTTSMRLTVDNCVLSSRSGKFIVASAADLELFQHFACGLDADYLQTANIDWNGDWASLATREDQFVGSYDGGGFSITGLSMQGGRASFIPYTSGATIRDLSLEVEVDGDYGSAGLVVYADDTLIEDVHISGTISTPVDSDDRGCIGGIAGETDTGTTVRRSSFEGTVSDPDGAWIGGLIACAYGGTHVEESYFVGDIEGFASLGGLVGWLEDSEIRDSYAIGSITGSSHEVGGLVGWQDGDGADADDTSVVDSYASTTVVGVYSVGALIGVGNAETIASSHWEEGLSGASEFDPIGELRDGIGTQPTITAVSASDMKTFSFFDDAGWGIVNGWADHTSSADVWGICTGSTTPFLLWEYNASPCTRAGGSPSGTPDTTEAREVSGTPRTTPTAVNGPTRPVGGTEIMVNGQRVSASIGWSNDSTIRGTIGGVAIAIRFEESTTTPDLKPVIARGGKFRLSLRGLQSKSSLIATMYSKPTRLGSFTVDALGSIKRTVQVPESRQFGAHRLRINMVDDEGRQIVLWLDLFVRSAKSIDAARVR